ncbi:MAG TPA: hypothetical protein K8V90_06500 [Romboutsia timonensis]|uniref:Zinc-ribbon domain-containing protein n=1 Tax=Romboutsia timonensis TaxID=1776391 RepID=A0A921N125_9FIRM|nr:hypothetical protein [Romboutsia timonensis]
MNKKEINKVKEMFLDNLPKNKNGNIDWVKSTGLNIRFRYEDIDGYISIVKYEKGRVVISYNNEVFWHKPILTDALKKCRIGYYLRKRTCEFKYELRTNLKDNERDLIITDREYRIDKNGQNQKYYKYTCNKCGWTEGWILEGNLTKGTGCSCCYGRTAVLGINTIWDTDRWMCDLGISEEDSKKHTKGSNKKVKVICPDCGKTKRAMISEIYSNKSIGCICSDSISYPEKFVANMLMQLNCKFQTQLTKTVLKWCGNKFYDFYIPSLSIIIETHGLQHYYDNKNFTMSLEEIQSNDKNKKELALNNGIKYYIELDCRHSNLEWIKNSILNSELVSLFDLSKVDWDQSDLHAIKNNKIKEICDYWNNKEEWETTYSIASLFNLDRTTVTNYLKKGTKLGWCVYDPKYEKSKASSKNGKLFVKQIEIFKDGESLGIFESCAELSRQSEKVFGVKLLSSNISRVCNGKLKQHKGFTFKYVENKDKYVA